MNFSSSVMNGMGISLGSLEIATDFLYANTDLYEPELTEVKTTISHKPCKPIITVKPIKPKVSKQSIINKFSLVGSKPVTTYVDEVIDDNVTLVQSSDDFDFSFDDEPVQKNDINEEEDMENTLLANDLLQRLNTESTTKQEETYTEDDEDDEISFDLSNIDDEDEEEQEDDNAFDVDNIDMDGMFGDDEEDIPDTPDGQIDDYEEESDDELDLDKLVADSKKKQEEQRQKELEEQKRKELEQQKQQDMTEDEEGDTEEDDNILSGLDDLGMDEEKEEEQEEEDLLGDDLDESDFFGDDEEEEEPYYEPEPEPIKPVQPVQPVQQVQKAPPKPVEQPQQVKQPKQIGQPKAVEKPKPAQAVQQVVQSVAEVIAPRNINTQEKEKIEQMQKQIEQMQAQLQRLDRGNTTPKASNVVEENVKKDFNVSRAPSEPAKNSNEAEYERYAGMQADVLYREVKEHMQKLGVTKKPVDISELNNKFGAMNIKKLINKSYLIRIGKGVTTGR